MLYCDGTFSSSSVANSSSLLSLGSSPLLDSLSLTSSDLAVTFLRNFGSTRCFLIMSLSWYDTAFSLEKLISMAAFEKCVSLIALAVVCMPHETPVLQVPSANNISDSL